MSKKFDVIVIGGGPGGYVAAIRAAQLGKTVACVEKRASLGGTCLNVGCIPSKALLDSSEHYSFANKKLKDHGVDVSSVKLNLKQMMKRKSDVVDQLCSGIEGLFKKNKITWIKGLGEVVKEDGGLSVQVTEKKNKDKYQAENIIIATGSSPVQIPGFDFDEKNILSSTGILSLDKVPKSLLVVGGGYIGLEMASVWNRLGTEVTVVEFAETIVPAMDRQLGKELLKSLKKQEMNFFLSHKCVSAKKSGTSLVVSIEDKEKGETKEIKCEKVLVSVGRKPVTEGLQLEKSGIKTDALGFIEVNDQLQTSVAGVYAIGDVVRGPMLAHKAEEEGVAVAETIAGQYGHVNYDVIPAVMFTHPEFASVGITEEQAKENKIDYKKGSFPFMANGRAKALGDVEGSAKIIADAKTDKVLGVHILGPRASDLIAEAASVMEFGGSSEDIARTCHAHPTLSEVVKEAALDVAKRKIHM